MPASPAVIRTAGSTCSASNTTSPARRWTARRSTTTTAGSTRRPSKSTRDPHIPFDGERIFTSDDVLQLDRLPRTLAVVGAGVIGCEYASIFAALGVRVTL